jgi:hypothetical protein
MYSSCREEIVEVFDALEADLDRALELSLDALTTPSGWSCWRAARRFGAACGTRASADQPDRRASRRDGIGRYVGGCAGRPAAHQPRGRLAPHWRGRRVGRPGPPTGCHHRQPRHRRDESDHGTSDSRGPRHPRRGLRETGPTRHVQPVRPGARRRRHALTGRYRRRYPQLRSTQPRRPQCGVPYMTHLCLIWRAYAFGHSEAACASVRPEVVWLLLIHRRLGRRWWRWWRLW